MKKHGIKIYTAAIFFFCLFFFTVLHPIPIMDGDDMVYIMQLRPAIPIPFAWNPSRVMPEVLMPIALIFCYTMTNTHQQTFADSNPISIDGNLALEIQNDICEQIIDGIESDAEEITVYVLQSIKHKKSCTEISVQRFYFLISIYKLRRR